MTPSFSTQGTSYLVARGINPGLAFACGVREANGAIVWPTVDSDRKLSPRRRMLGNVAGPKVRGLKGRTLGVWWPLGRPERISGDVLICEGESDAMAAASTDAAADGLSVCSGTAAKLDVLISELLTLGATVAALAFDGDMVGGLKADRLAGELVRVGIGARILAIPHGEDLGSVLGGEVDPSFWLQDALLRARPIALDVAALIAENRWLRTLAIADLELQRRD